MWVERRGGAKATKIKVIDVIEHIVEVPTGANSYAAEQARVRKPSVFESAKGTDVGSAP